jgi:hypothetical protein
MVLDGGKCSSKISAASLPYCGNVEKSEVADYDKNNVCVIFIPVVLLLRVLVLLLIVRTEEHVPIRP